MGSNVGSAGSGTKVSEFIPTCEWEYEQDLLVLNVDVPGFERDRLKVEYEKCGRLRISGERPGLTRFSKVFLVPGKCTEGEIRAVYRRDRQVLRIVMPGKTSGSSPVDTGNNMPNPKSESKLPSKTQGEPRGNGRKIAINVAAAAAVLAVIGVVTFFIICKAR